MMVIIPCRQNKYVRLQIHSCRILRSLSHDLALLLMLSSLLGFNQLCVEVHCGHFQYRNLLALLYLYKCQNVKTLKSK